MATMAEMPAPAVAGRGNLPGAAAGGSSDTDTSSRIHHTQHKAHHSSHNSDDTEIPSSSQAPPQSVAAASSSSSYAFITHSQEGLRENRPPMIDNAGLARRRRRRTSQHDQAILEEEYRKCDRPDKAKRREIAAMVEMGDKEVQIWFQNKRQSARRKLKPLLPHEIIPNAMKSSSSPAPSYQHHHHYHHHRTGYTGLWSKEESRVEEELERQGRNEEKMRDMKKFRDRHLDFGPVEEPLSRADREGNAIGGRARNSSSQECSMRESHREQEQEVECLDQGSSQDQEFSSSQSSSQNHGYYSQQETPARGGQDDGDKVDDEQKLPPAAVRRMSMSHMRLQEALSSPLRPPPPPPPARAASLLPTPQSTQQQRRYSFAREPPSELSEYIHSDFPQQQTPIKPPPVPPLALPTPQATNPRRTNPQGAYQPPSLQKRSSSFLRLSTSIDGHAEVVIDTEPTLPPPLPHSRSDQMTPRRGVPVPSTSSVLRDIDNMRSSRLWEFCCDKQKQPYLSSEGGLAGIPHHHHHHSALEPDEAGMALSIARSRRRVGALKEARRKLVFDDVELMRDDSGLGALIDDPEVQRRGSFYEDDGPFGGGKIHCVEKAVKKSSNSSIEKKRVSLGDLGSAIRTPARSGTVKSSTYMTNSTSRKRAYHEIEIYEQPSSSQTTDPLPSTKRRASGALPMQLSDVKKKQQFSSPRGRAGGEDYYIFGHESDKENYGEGQVEDSHDGGKAVFGEIINNGKQQRPMKATKKPLEKDREKWRSGEKVLPPPLSSMDVAKKQKVKVIHRDNAVGRREEKRLKKKRKVLGEVAGGPQSQVQSSAQTQPVDLKRKERPQSQRQGEGQGRTDSDVDLGGAELLLSLSAGRWGC